MSDEPDASNSRFSRRLVVVVILIEVLFCIALVAVVVHVRGQHDASTNTLARPTGIPASVSTSLANQMGLSPITGSSERAFTLTDQRGRPVALSALRGHVVVLQFMDPHCTDICPIAASEVLDAYRDLGARRADVDFITVNVNRYAETPADMMSFTKEHGLANVPTWHFVTGSTATLKKIWYNYDIEVVATSPTADIVHSDQIYFIAPDGNIGFLATTNVRYTKAGKAYLPPASIEQWGHAIAHVAASLLTS